MNGFMMLTTQNGKLLYISDNAAEYLGHSMVSPMLVVEECRHLLTASPICVGLR